MSDDRCGTGDRETNLEQATDGGQSPLNRILQGLQNAPCRYVLYYLQEEEQCQIEEAASHVVAWKEEWNPEDVPSESREPVKIELYHTHLPKLAELNIIDYDERSGAIRLRDPPDRLDDFLELTRLEDEST